MSCLKINCFLKRNFNEGKENFEDLEEQLNKCNSCVENTKDEIKHKTRNIIGAKYVSEYWKNLGNN